MRTTVRNIAAVGKRTVGGLYVPIQKMWQHATFPQSYVVADQRYLILF